jgi:hypothetical protein
VVGRAFSWISNHDLTIARSGFVMMLEEGETASADKGYIGDRHFLTPFKPADTLEENLFNRKLARHHVKVENFNCKLKKFKLFTCAFKCTISSHLIKIPKSVP